MSQRVGIAAVLVVHEGRALVGRRPLTAASAAGYAEFPGGKVRPGETAAAAARRECREETGLEVVIEALIASGRVADTGRPINFYSGRPAPTATAVPQPPFAWLTAEDVAACRFPPANAAAVEWLIHQLSRPREE